MNVVSRQKLIKTAYVLHIEYSTIVHNLTIYQLPIFFYIAW